MSDVLALQAIETPEQEQNEDLPGSCSLISAMCSNTQQDPITG